jgi:hypothetical protein
VMQWRSRNNQTRRYASMPTGCILAFDLEFNVILIDDLCLLVISGCY